MKAGDVRHFIFASPGNTIVERLAQHLTSDPAAREIHIGDCAFILDSVRVVNSSLEQDPVKIICATPILLRIPEYNYDHYAVPQEERRQRYVYWRPQISFEAFIKQLTENMVKKYNDTYGTSVGSFPLFQEFIFKKTVHARYIIDGKSYGAAGSLWEFSWNRMDEMQRRIISFGFDAGFGERNSFGFGFVNVVKGRKQS